LAVVVTVQQTIPGPGIFRFWFPRPDWREAPDQMPPGMRRRAYRKPNWLRADRAEASESGSLNEFARQSSLFRSRSAGKLADIASFCPREPLPSLRGRTECNPAGERAEQQRAAEELQRTSWKIDALKRLALLKGQPGRAMPKSSMGTRRRVTRRGVAGSSPCCPGQDRTNGRLVIISGHHVRRRRCGDGILCFRIGLEPIA